MKISDLKLAWFLSKKSLFYGDRWSLVLVLLIMMIVFVNLLFTDAIFAGIIKGIDTVKINYQYGELIIEPKDGERYIHNVDKIESWLYADRHVLNVSPQLSAGAIFVNQKNKDGRDEDEVASALEAYYPGDNLFDFDKVIIDGEVLGPYDRNFILLGSGLSGGYGASVFPDDLGAVKPGQKILVKINGLSREYTVKGIFKTKNFNIDRRAFVLDKELNSAIGTTKEASRIVIRLDNPEYAFILKKRMLNDELFDGYAITDWKEKLALGSSISKSFDMIGQVLRVIGALLAGLVVFIVIFVDIVNKRRQLGILKAIGLQNKILISDYIFRGLFYALFGILLGFLFMLLIIYFFRYHPIKMPMADVVPLLTMNSFLFSSLFFAIAGIVGSFIPAKKALSQSILDLLYR